MTKIYTVITLLLSFTLISYAQKELNVSASTIDASIGKSNGSIHLTITNGEAPYNLIHYSDYTEVVTLSNINDSSINIENISSGEYTIIIRDKNFNKKILTVLLKEENTKR